MFLGVGGYDNSSLGEPISPKSQCKSRGLHYYVRDRRHGFFCEICGIAGDLEFLKSIPCEEQGVHRSPKTSVPYGPGSMSEGDFAMAEAVAATTAEQLKHQDDMAYELEQLRALEEEQEQLILLETLETEEMILQDLLLQDRALALAEKMNKKDNAPRPDLKRAEPTELEPAPSPDSTRAVPASPVEPVTSMPTLLYGSLESIVIES